MADYPPYTSSETAADLSAEKVAESIVGVIEAAKSDPSITIDLTGDTIAVHKDNRDIIISRRHHIYLHDIWTAFDAYYETVQPKELNDRLVVDYSVPAWHVIRDTGEAFFFSSFAEDIGSTRLYQQYLTPVAGDVVLDLGAYCGLSAVNFARAVGPTGRVFALEADPLNFEILQRNIEASSANNVTLRHNAVFGERGTLLFSSEGNMGSAVVSAPKENRGNLVHVEGITLDDIATEYGLDHVDVIKMDIEGSEYSVLDNSRDFLTRFRPRMAIELHAYPWPDGNIAYEKARKILDELGYFTKYISGSMITALPEKVVLGRSQQHLADLDNARQDARRWQDLAAERLQSISEALRDARHWQELAEEHQRSTTEARDDARRWQDLAEERQRLTTEAHEAGRRWQDLAEESQRATIEARDEGRRWHDQVEAIKASTSWKLTAPIRQLRRSVQFR